jgi:CheY-like chemotaxis protein
LTFIATERRRENSTREGTLILSSVEGSCAWNLHEQRFVSRPKILIVDDDSDVRRLYAIGLNQRGFEVKLAANGAEALERITSGEKPDIILLDWLMPLMDGGEVMSKLAGDTGTADIPVIVISGQPAPQEKLDPRIQCWLTKPVSVDDLVGYIERPPNRRGPRIAEP